MNIVHEYYVSEAAISQIVRAIRFRWRTSNMFLEPVSHLCGMYYRLRAAMCAVFPRTPVSIIRFAHFCSLLHVFLS